MFGACFVKNLYKIISGNPFLVLMEKYINGNWEKEGSWNTFLKGNIKGCLTLIIIIKYVTW